MQFFSLTDRGKLRTNNQDCCGAKQIGQYTLLVLADGMGGHKGGETASLKAIETVFSLLDEGFMQRLIPAQIPKALSQVIEKANTVLYKLSQSDSSLRGMGTTIDICIIREDTAYIAHIGDSRVYKVSSQGEISRFTKDHSLIEYMIDTGALSPEEAKNHPQKNVITRALGTTPQIEADIMRRTISDGDRLLLCSDGLSNMLNEEDIARIMSQEASLSDCAHKLVQHANDAGGADNITVVVAQK